MRRIATAFALTLAATPALAHHPLAGAPMETFVHGVLSGVGHPLLGFDHLAFIIALGIAARFTARPLLAQSAAIAAILFGCLVASAGVTVGFAEPMIALSLIAVGAVVAFARRLGPLAIALLAGFGLFHGVAYGGAIFGVEANAGAVSAGYLIGLAVTQWVIAAAAGLLAEQTLRRSGEPSAVRLAGAAVAGIGIFLTLETLEGLAFSAIGIA